MRGQSHLFNAAFIDDLYETYLTNPSQVSEHWRQYFAQLQQEQPTLQPEIPHTLVQSRFIEFKSPHTPLWQKPIFTTTKPLGRTDEAKLITVAKKEAEVLRLIDAYRFRGHQQAHLDPLQMQERPLVEDLNLAAYDLSEADLLTVFDAGSLCDGNLTLAEIIDRLKKIYCGTIGAEYMYITDSRQKRWIQERLESALWKPDFPNFDRDTKLRILELLTAAQGLEDYLQAKYVGQKRFSLEGGDTLIALLDELIQSAGAAGVEEIVMGMAHRGRLNVLVNTLGKRPKDLFSEFEGKIRLNTVSSGDVKYHQGFSADVTTPGGPLHVTLSFNPSHLEIICPVVEGSIRARQDRRDDHQHNCVLPVLIHGDAAFAGQGVIMETLNLSQTRGYSTGGTIHVVINNQIGFTTSDPLDSRSTLYCTDVAKMVQAPIFHVNGDDPEAVLFLTRLAIDFRMTFHKDVVLDMVCYRRQGHNESDEPAATQPVMYQKIAKQMKVQSLYANQLVKDGIIRAEEGELMLQEYRAALKTKDVVSQHVRMDYKNAVNWKPYMGTHWTTETNTCISQESLQQLVKKFTTVPTSFKLHRTVEKLVETWQKMGTGELPFDWGCAETLAYASLLTAGYPIRLSGQDTGRGTFAHRHAMWHHAETGDTYVPLQHLFPRQANFLVINSLLSEEAVLGFEVGYSASEPEALVIWEAQFGDFSNNAQVVIDQFISSSETKWQRLCPIVMFLPHGYDGQGPEHSSARLERYLQLCAEDNIQICIPSTPAQFFHMLRRHMLRPYRKPLVVMTPKSLLRHKSVVSPIADFTDKGFQLVIDESDPNISPDKVKRLLFCSGKVYYDLLEARTERGIDNIAIVRLEQLYPYPKDAMAQVLARYPHVSSRMWVQEEPQNQGAWWYMQAHMDVNLAQAAGQLELAGRPASASPAAGYLQIHRQQLQDLLNSALNL